MNKREQAQANTEGVMDDLGLDFKEVADQAQNMTLNEANEFIDQLANKIVLQLITDNLNYTNPITSMFMKEGLDMGSAMEVVENKIIEPSDYDKTKIIPTHIAQKILSEVIKTKGKKIFELNISLAIVKGAFTSFMKFDQFVQNLIGQLDKSVEVYLLQTLTEEIKNGVLNVKDLGSLSTEDAWSAIIKDVKNWKLPSVAHNLGFADPSDVANKDLVHTNVSTPSDVVFLLNPNTRTDLELKVLADKFNKSFFEIEQFGGILDVPLADNEVIPMDKRAYLFYWRIKEIATQAFAKPLMIYYAMHVWHVNGLIPWSNGKKFNWTDPAPTLKTNDEAEVKVKKVTKSKVKETKSEPKEVVEEVTLADDTLTEDYLKSLSFKELKTLAKANKVKVQGRATIDKLILALVKETK